jgi:hypothetical protein
MCRCVGRIVECGHCFSPFGEVVNDDYNVLVSIVGWRVACHEINAPFTEGANVIMGCKREGGARALCAYN